MIGVGECNQMQKMIIRSKIETLDCAACNNKMMRFILKLFRLNFLVAAVFWDSVMNHFNSSENLKFLGKAIKIFMRL